MKNESYQLKLTRHAGESTYRRKYILSINEKSKYKKKVSRIDWDNNTSNPPSTIEMSKMGSRKICSEKQVTDLLIKVERNNV